MDSDKQDGIQKLLRAEQEAKAAPDHLPASQAELAALFVEYACPVGGCYCGGTQYIFDGDSLSTDCGKKQWTRASGAPGSTVMAAN